MDMWTGLELGVSVYHAFTEIHEAMASGLARALMHGAEGDPVGMLDVQVILHSGETLRGGRPRTTLEPNRL